MSELTSPARALRVFLCHSSDDKPAVRALYKRLHKQGFDPWLDEEKLIPGQNWPLEITKAMRSCDLVLVCLSKNSVSKKGYVQKEIKLAFDVADEQPEGIIFLVPLRLEECDVPERLKELIWVDLFEHSGFERLTRTLYHRASSVGLRKDAPARDQPGITIGSTLRSAAKTIRTLFFDELAIDCGSANTLIYAIGRGIVISEPSIILVNEKTKTVVSAGREAKERMQDGYRLYRPIGQGRILNSDIAGAMLRLFIRRAREGPEWPEWIGRPRVILAICSDMEDLYRLALIEAAHYSKAGEVYLVNSILCAAIGEGIPIKESHAMLVVDIGAETIEVAVVASNGIVCSRTIRLGSRAMDESIIVYIKRKYFVLVGERTAEAIKIELGSAYPLDEPLAYEIRGQNLIEGIPKTITLSDEEVREALADVVSIIINCIFVALERVPQGSPPTLLNVTSC